MQSEQQQELYRLTDEAADALNAVPESGSFTHVFSYWRLPAFYDHTRTTLYTPNRSDGEKRPFITITTWRRDVDLDKLRDPIERLKHPKFLNPTIEESAFDVSPGSVADAVATLSEISLPALRPIEKVVGLDGIGFRFSFSQGFYALDISWWMERPQAWNLATGRLEELVARLESQAPTKKAEQAAT